MLNKEYGSRSRTTVMPAVRSVPPARHSYDSRTSRRVPLPTVPTAPTPARSDHDGRACIMCNMQTTCCMHASCMCMLGQIMMGS